MDLRKVSGGSRRSPRRFGAFQEGFKTTLGYSRNLMSFRWFQPRPWGSLNSSQTILNFLKRLSKLSPLTWHKNRLYRQYTSKRSPSNDVYWYKYVCTILFIWILFGTHIVNIREKRIYFWWETSFLSSGAATRYIHWGYFLSKLLTFSDFNNLEWIQELLLVPKLY